MNTLKRAGKIMLAFIGAPVVMFPLLREYSEPYLAAAVLVMFQLIGPWSMTRLALVLPLGLQEMVIAVWLIAKGFNSSAIAAGESALNELQLRASEA